MSTQDPDEIRDDIEQTQRDLSASVDALTARLSPQRIVQDKVQRARIAMGSMKEGTVSSATSSAARTAGTVTAAARRGIEANPVAAVLIAFGAGWLIAALLPSPGRSSGRRRG
jgi:Protein of unknown function (DUF3618)